VTESEPTAAIATVTASQAAASHMAARQMAVRQMAASQTAASQTTASQTTAVLLLSHGSRDPRARYVVSELVTAVAAVAGSTVRAAHLDFTPPAPVVALQELAADGFTSVRVVPLLFTPGYHLTHDVPLAVAASGVTGRMHVSVAPPLLSGGRRARGLLLRALADRLVQAGADGQVVRQTDGQDDGRDDGQAVRRADGLVLASAGSSSQAARRCIGSLVADLQRAHGIPVEPAFASGASLSPARALEALSERGARRPAVASLFVAPGRLSDSVVAACPGLPVADPLGVSPAFVELLVEQARALSRTI
jgi:sirohydrochlorin ferrochelatase